MTSIALALVFAFGAQDLDEALPALRAYRDATSFGQPFKRECYRDQQADWLRRIGLRLQVAEKKLIARYGEEKTHYSTGIVIEGAVKRWAPCDAVKQHDFLAGWDEAVTALEKTLKSK